jgi:pyruvate dehydrogenase E1 component alpha subunit
VILQQSIQRKCFLEFFQKYGLRLVLKPQEKLIELYRAGIKGLYHLYIGEEAVSVGICTALRKDDYIFSTHRGKGHYIAKGGDLKR